MTAELGIFEIMSTTRAMRRLKPDPVPEELLVRLIEAAQMAPSGSNNQPSRWIIVRDQERRERLAALNRAAVEAYLERNQATLAALPPIEAEAKRRIYEAVRWQGDHMAELPALIIPCIALNSPRQESFVNGLGVGASVWPGVQNLLLAARALGLGAALTTMSLGNRQAFKDVVGLPEDIEPVGLIPIGFPRGKFGPVRRRPVTDVLRWDVWS